MDINIKGVQKTSLIDYWYQQDNLSNLELDNFRSNSIENSIEAILLRLNIPSEIFSNYLETIYLQVYGWSSFMNWRNNHQDNPWVPGQDPCEVILFIWLCYEYSIALETDQKYNYEAQVLSTNSDNTIGISFFIMLSK